jgi:hypothetical protein
MAGWRLQEKVFNPLLSNGTLDCEKFLWGKGVEVCMLRFIIEIISKSFKLPKGISPLKYG